MASLIDLAKLTGDRKGYPVEQLKEFSRQLGLPLGGTKTILVNRIRDKLGLPKWEALEVKECVPILKAPGNPPRAIVVRIRRKGGVVVQDCDTYIGRAQRQGGWNLDDSKWGNVFKVGRDGTIEEVCQKYEEYVRNSSLWDQLGELTGKRLGCWCHNEGEPGRCHGDILVKLLIEKGLR